MISTVIAAAGAVKAEARSQEGDISTPFKVTYRVKVRDTIHTFHYDCPNSWSPGDSSDSSGGSTSTANAARIAIESFACKKGPGEFSRPGAERKPGEEKPETALAKAEESEPAKTVTEPVKHAVEPIKVVLEETPEEKPVIIKEDKLLVKPRILHAAKPSVKKPIPFTKEQRERNALVSSSPAEDRAEGSFLAIAVIKDLEHPEKRTPTRYETVYACRRGPSSWGEVKNPSVIPAVARMQIARARNVCRSIGVDCNYLGYEQGLRNAKFNFSEASVTCNNMPGSSWASDFGGMAMNSNFEGCKTEVVRSGYKRAEELVRNQYRTAHGCQNSAASDNPASQSRTVDLDAVAVVAPLKSALSESALALKGD